MPGGLGTAGGKQGGWYLFQLRSVQVQSPPLAFHDTTKPTLLIGCRRWSAHLPHPPPPLPNTPIYYLISRLPLLIEPLCSKLLYSLFPLSQMLFPIRFTSSLSILNSSSQKSYSCLPNINPPSCHLWPLTLLYFFIIAFITLW